MFINDLPEENLIEIFSYLTHVELFFVARKVCLLWNDVCMSNPLWNAIDVDKEISTICRERHSGIFGIGPRFFNDEILTNMLLEINPNIRCLKFNTTVVPLRSTSEGIRRNDQLHCFICNILFKTHGNNNTTNLATTNADDITCGNRENEHSCQNDELKYSVHKDGGAGSADLVHEDIKKSTESNTVQINHLKISESFTKREFDFIKIRETLKPLNFVQLDHFLSRIGIVKSLGIYTTKVFAAVSNESLGNLRKMNGLVLHVGICDKKNKPYNQREQDDSRDVEMKSSFRFLFENLQNVTKLITDIMSNDALRLLFRNNRKLRHLSLIKCNDLTEDAFANMPVLDHLVHLEISSCSRITDTEVEVLANCCKNLRHINLKRCVGVTHKSIKLLITKCVWLTELHAEGKPFEEFVKNFEMMETNSAPKPIHIRKLSLDFFSENGKITDNLVKSIANFCPEIRELHLKGQYLLTDTGIDYVIQKCKDLKIVYIWKYTSSTFNDGSLFGGVKIEKVGENFCKNFLPLPIPWN